MATEVGRPHVARFRPTAPIDARPSEIEFALTRSRSALERGAPGEALRWADRAQRLCPSSAEIAELKARLLMRRGAATEALAELRKIDAGSRISGVRALLADALFELHRGEDAMAVLHEALQAFAVSPGDALAECASRRCGVGPGMPRGWVCVGPDLRVWGEVVSGVSPDSLSIASDGRALTPEWSRTAGRPSRSFVLGLTGQGEVTAHARGAPLLGSGLAFPPDVRLDGRCSVEDGELRGWARLDWAPLLSPTIVVRDRIREIGRAVSAPDTDGHGRHAFKLRIPRLRVGRAQSVAVELGDGRSIALPTSPAIIELPPAPSGKRGRKRKGVAPATASRRPVDVIVPAYDGPTATARCLASVQATIGDAARIIIVNDASPSPAVAETLREFARLHGATLIEHPSNLGFAAAVNRALQVNPAHDAVILNADAEVFPGWLERLRDAAYSAPDIGTVTPLSDTGAIASYPPGLARPLETGEAATIARLAAAANDGVRVEAPTGVGFCLYVRRDCLDETGAFDARTFGRGYGEENDFCLRAAERGWRHLIAADVFVRHEGSRSFGAATAAALRERNGAVLARRYPGYAAAVEAFQAEDPLRIARRRIGEARLAILPRPFHLLVSLADPGGVDRVIERRCREILEAGGTPLVLRPDTDGDAVRLSMPGWKDDSLGYDPDRERAEFLRLAGELSPDEMELHHAYGHDSTLIDELIGVCRRLTVFVHDYSLICPRLVLIGGSGRYCGEPDLDGCAACVAANGSSLREDITTAALRARSAAWLARAARVVAPSRDTQARLGRYFPDVTIELDSWETDTPEPPVAKPTVSQTIKVAVIGAIGAQKGYQVLLACARDAAERLLPIEFVVIGYTVDDEALLAVGNSFVTGRFDETDIAQLIGREAPDVALFASVTPETHCFSLTHALEARVPIVAFDHGAIAERLRGRGPGASLLPPDSGATAINNALLAAVLSIHGGPPPRRKALIGQPELGTEKGQRLLAADGGAEQSGSVVLAATANGLTASPQLLTLGRGIYSFSVKSAAPQRAGGGGIVLPALHIALAPGVPAESAEILTGLRADGAWLYDTSDVVLAKVRVAGSSVLVTSYAMPGLQPLSIDVEQIDARPEDDAAGPPARLSGPPAARLAPAGNAADGRQRVALGIDAHISMIGDVSFSDADWVGAVSQGFPIEAFRVRPLEQVSNDEIEYRALTLQGQETPWIAGGELCGVRGQAASLTGLAFRLRGERASRFECAYSAIFASGAVVGPLTQGIPARGRGADDVLIGFQLTVVEASPSLWAPADAAGPPTDERNAGPIGPRFSTFREENR